MNSQGNIFSLAQLPKSESAAHKLMSACLSTPIYAMDLMPEKVRSLWSREGEHPLGAFTSFVLDLRKQARHDPHGRERFTGSGPAQKRSRSIFIHPTAHGNQLYDGLLQN